MPCRTIRELPGRSHCTHFTAAIEPITIHQEYTAATSRRVRGVSARLAYLQGPVVAAPESVADSISIVFSARAGADGASGNNNGNGNGNGQNGNDNNTSLRF